MEKYTFDGRGGIAFAVGKITVCGREFYCYSERHLENLLEVYEKAGLECGLERLESPEYDFGDSKFYRGTDVENYIKIKRLEEAVDKLTVSASEGRSEITYEQNN